MIALGFVINLFGASMLLLFAVRLVRTGVERSFGQQLRHLLNNAGGNLGAAASGCMLAIMLQGATAVILMISGLVSAGITELATGLAIAIGADIGSAIVVRILTFNIDWLIPLLAAVGGWVYLKVASAQFRNIGRAILGIALILMALKLIGESVSPVKEASFLPEIAAYLERDLVLAFLLGTAFTFLLHSSVASILVCVTMVHAQAASLVVGIAFILGANIGSALIPVWLTRGSDIAERHLPLLNLLVRGIAATAAFIAMATFHQAVLPHIHVGPVAVVIGAHLAFNTLLLGFLPFAGGLARVVKTWLPETAGADFESSSRRLLGATEAEKLEIGNSASVMRRDTLTLLDSVSNMISASEKLVNQHSDAAEQSVHQLQEKVTEGLHQMRVYFSRNPKDGLSKSTQREMRQLMEYAVRLKHSGDIVAKRVVAISREMHENQLSFSNEGRAELEELRCLALANTFLAFEVVSTWNHRSARDLIARKEEVSKTEQRSKKRHFKRISSSGTSVSLETSDLHLELSSAFKEINSKIATIAYVVLAGEGQLADSRLLSDPDLKTSSRN